MPNISVKFLFKKRDLDEVSLSETTTVGELKNYLQTMKGVKVHKHRQGLKVAIPGKKDAKGKDLMVKLADESASLSSIINENDLSKKETLTVKVSDYGPQFSYRGVFVIEYAGPLFIMLLYAARLFDPSLGFVGTNPGKDEFVAALAVWCWVGHFVKRELETLFVHKFSRPTMPLMNLFRNSIYYWTFGAFVGYPLCHSGYTPPKEMNQVYIGLAIFLISEFFNLCVHLQFMTMRPKEGSKLRPMPTGFLFTFVSCPNYFWEVMGWIGFSIMTNIALSWIFTLCGFYQMAIWAKQKHKNYLKTYGKAYKATGRKALVPFLF